MIGIYIEVMRDMVTFCKSHEYDHEDFDAFTQLVDSFDEIHSVVISLIKIKKIVAHHFGLIPWELDKKTRCHKYRFPRQVGQYYGWLLTDERLEDIGKIIGKNIHATVINSRRKIRNLRETKFPWDDYIKLREVDEIFAPYLLKKKEKDQINKKVL